MPFYLLLAMQAAGMVTDYLGAQSQSEMMDMGMKVQQAGIEANIEQNRLDTANDSLENMKSLRQTIGSQIAVMAARGTSTSAGSAASLFNENTANFNADERIRKLNSMGKENQLRAGGVMSRLQNSSDISKLWQGFGSRTLNRFPSSVSGWKQAGSEFNDSIKPFTQGG
jgi:hypothetical protein